MELIYENNKNDINSDIIIKSFIGKNINIKGSIYKIKDMKEFMFLILDVNNELIQCICNKNINNSNSLNLFDFIEISGIVNSDERSKLGFEIIINNISIISKAYEGLPIIINKKKITFTLETDLQNRPFSLKHPIKKAIFKIQGLISYYFSEYLINNNFIQIHTPKIVAKGAEGGANLFQIKYFDQSAFLAQSPQFYKQYMASVFGKVFEIGPIYRAEKHSTSRHLNEYIGLDLEIININDINDLMQIQINIIKYIFNKLNKSCLNELHLLNIQLPIIENIPSFTFYEIKEILKKEYNYSSNNIYDLDPHDELLIYKYVLKKFNNEFAFITHFPIKNRPFYVKNSCDGKYALSFDLLFRGLEVTTGGQRIHDYNEQIEKILSFGLDIKSFNEFLNLHKYGMPPHGGLGMGLERFCMKMLLLNNIREASLFPRDLNRINP